MDKLCGPESLQVVCHRFSNGVDVLKCISGFIKEVSEVEQSYSNSLQKLVKSPLYELHSNFIMQLLGSNPYEEIGTVKHTWSELGHQLSILATLHAEKAKAYLNEVRQPLLDLVPKLEEARREIRNRARQLRDDLESAAGRHQRMKLKYNQVADSVDKYWQKVSTARSETSLTASQRLYMKNENKLAVLEAELTYQETVYHDAYTKHLEMRERFDRSVKELYVEVHTKETERVSTIKKSLQEFARTLSNTAPTYLEAMQRIVFSIDNIDSDSDIDSFVQQHASLMQQTQVPPFEKHPMSTRSKEAHTHHDSQSGGLSSVRAGSIRARLRGGKASSATPPVGGVHSQSPGQEEQEGASHPTKPKAREEPEGSASLSQHHLQDHDGKPRPKQPIKPARAEKPSTREKPASIKVQHVSTKATNDGGRSTPQSHTESETAANSVSKVQQVTSHGPRHQHKPKATTALSAATMGKPSPAAKLASLEATQTRHSGRVASAIAPVGEERGPSNHVRPSHTVAKEPSRNDEEEHKLLKALQVMARDNDYYGLLQVDLTASKAELDRARRERARELHPDHFTSDEEQREIAQDEMVRVNQAYHDVLANSESRELYNQLCNFRTKYHLVMNQKLRGLLNARDRLSELRKKLKRSRCPQMLLEELDSALYLIQTRIDMCEPQA